MQRLEQTNNQSVEKYYTSEAKQLKPEQSIANMVERFVQSIGQLNDSGSFDTSFEVKNIETPQRIRHRCVTELDREHLMQFVRDFEARQTLNKSSTAKCASPYLCRKAKELYQRAANSRASTPTRNNEQIYEDSPTSTSASPLQKIMKSAEAEDLMAPPTALQRAQPERNSCRSAAKVLQFFSAKKKSTKCSAADSSPVELRTQLGCQPLPQSDGEDEKHNGDDDDAENDFDDGISSASSNFKSQSSNNSSRNISPDSSFELHAPLLPTFKVTPSKTVCRAGKNAAYEFARFLRGSFHAKRATVKSLRRSLSDPDSMEHLDFTKPCALSHKARPKAVLSDTTNLMRNRPLPANASPFRRAWGQSSFRTGRTDKHSNTASGQQQELVEQRNSPVVRRTASMTASDNDVYVKSMDGFIDELKQQTRSSRAQQKLMMVPQIHTKQPTPAASDDTDGPYGVAAWGTSFERMLQDTAGMQTFAEFLKKEFSAENIYFWTACERYRLLESEAERITQAHEIYNKHLSNESKDPVNVDSQARNLSKEKLESGATDIFAPAQKQIFNLMKFDSYQRFIRSDLYRSCLEAEEKQQALPYSGEGLDELLKTNFHVLASSTKLKKSASNAEDRRRKSLLPWHRKTRSKSRDRNELLNEVTCSSGSNGQKVNTLMLAPPNKLATLSSSSLKIASTQNSLSDVYSSRSSLSSYDANTANAQTAEMVCSLCRVILSDGATTIVQTRADETVGQLVERLLEKRGLSYQYYDVVFNGCTKSIDMQLPSQTLAGKEVLIEQRVVFKLDLPDPKVISVKSKPKKQLYDVIRPILHKYNYSMSGVQVLLRDTLAQIDLTQSVTVADGQRLKIVLLQPSQSQQDFQQSGGTSLPPKLTKPMTASKFGNIPPTLTSRSVSIQSNRTSVGSVVGANTTNCSTAAASQSTLDEITNKVFNELLQGKVEAQRTCDLSSLKSEDCASETSSIFDRMRRRDSNIPGSKLPKFKKKSTSSQQSEDAMQTTTTLSLLIDPKKPIIAKLKAGVKLQVTERVAEHQDELLEGLKRAQLARLEDQRGTEINCELPEFLKHKENLSAASKLRKARANLSPITKPPPTSPTSLSPTEALSSPSTSCAPPQPAPRLSITQKHKTVSPMKVDEEDEQLEDTNGVTMQESTILPVESNPTVKGPPPLPPKPKVLPIKPSNWGVSSSISTGKHISPSMTAASSKIPIEIGRKALLTAEQTSARCAYLDEPSSSFV